MNKYQKGSRTGFSMMELLAVLTILGIIAAIIVPRLTDSSDTAKQKLDAHHRALINSAVERWYIESGEWPASDLSDISRDKECFPEGVPRNPVSGKRYTLDETTHRVQ